MQKVFLALLTVLFMSSNCRAMDKGKGEEIIEKPKAVLNAWDTLVEEQKHQEYTFKREHHCTTSSSSSSMNNGQRYASTWEPEIIEQPAKRAKIDTHSNTIWNAVARNDIETVRALLKKGIDPTETSTEINYDYPGCIQIHGPITDVGETPLHRTQNPQVAQLLVEHGFDINAQTARRLTPLHFAIHNAFFNHNTAMVEWLLKNGADIQAEDAFGLTPIEHLSLPESNKTILRLYLDNRKIGVEELLKVVTGQSYQLDSGSPGGDSELGSDNDDATEDAKN
jgi:hypothetical protein